LSPRGEGKKRTQSITLFTLLDRFSSIGRKKRGCLYSGLILEFIEEEEKGGEGEVTFLPGYHRWKEGKRGDQKPVLCVFLSPKGKRGGWEFVPEEREKEED